MDETRSGVCEVERVPGIGVHGDESDNSRTGLGDESFSASENIFVGSRSDNSMSSEHGREAIINMDIDNDYERDITEVALDDNSNEEIYGLENVYDYYGESDVENCFYDESVGGNHYVEPKPSNSMQSHVDDGDDANLSLACQAEDTIELYMMIKEMTFPSEEAAFEFYNSYAKDNGFSIRLDKDYEDYGDVLVFDSTYKMNRYRMPFIPFVGLNNHRRTTVFGCAIVSDETEETYVWLLQTFLKAMCQKKPLSVITDADSAMIRAIRTVFPDVWHRICSWHVEKNMKIHLSHKSLGEFRSMLYYSTSIAEFEQRWQAFLKRWKTENTEIWLKRMYRKRHLWAAAFLTEGFWLGMKSNQRSESLNSCLHLHLDGEMTLVDMILHYENCITRIRENEAHDDCTASQTLPVPVTSCRDLENIPCYVRKYINKSASNTLTVESGDRGVYQFLLNKMEKKTRIFGPDYNKFLTDYDMHLNEKIRFDIIEEEENLFVTALDIEDNSKELVKEVFHFEGDAKSIFISKTVELKNSEIININSRVNDRGLGLGGVFVHRLSTYDVASNALRIPKTIVSVLDVRPSGDIYFLRGEDDDDSPAVYYTSVDGRIRFKSGWTDFCVKNNLVAGQLVMCLFFKMEGMLFMSVDVIE
ncbi:hypothetical protein QYE76_025941 [Lolium multiflorum]|uniref:TF-B3 domain-containing protein n=1 Tax=Lolium multiflorum TaxID=4521 RepID=A0AAD8RHS5_LOLMU|nr:hypothetical protein QYE76_025941 [Lolium multiflorum]